jgi:glycosyltransferase involved in cell wall biosynthesis
MLYNRDLPTEMIRGFDLAMRNGVHVKMTIIGATDIWKVAKETIQTIRSDSRLRENISVTGYIPETQYDEILGRADAFVLLRPDTWESRACFPTRLPQFLCTGKPVITSNVGDIAMIFRDRVDICLLPTNNQAAALSDVIHFLASQREEARRIGIAGCEKAFQEFSCVKHGIRLRDFLSSIQHS